MRMGSIPIRESVSYGPERVHFYMGDRPGAGMDGRRRRRKGLLIFLRLRSGLRVPAAGRHRVESLRRDVCGGNPRPNGLF